MYDNMLDIINIAQLEILGVQEEHLYTVLLCFIIMILSVILVPFMIWLIRRQYMYVLVYLVGSLIFMTLIPLIPLFVTKGFPIQKYVLICSVYGFIYACFILFQYLRIIKKGV